MNIRRGWREYDNCPRCGQANETVEHVMKFPQPEARETWNEAIGELRNWIEKNNSEPEMIAIICSTLAAWGNLRLLPSFQTQTRELQLAMDEQDRIG